MSIVCPRCGTANAAHAKFCAQCGASISAPPGPSADPLLGRVIAERYRVLSLLGEGAMGRVYLAEQRMGTALRHVAIKVVLLDMAADRNVIARFYRECELVVSLSHPNTIRVFDFGELADKTLYIVMEYIEGPSLAAVLEKSKTLAPERVEHIVVQICGSLHEAHQHGIVHRDLKPDNVLLATVGGQPDFVKVLDFGIAKRVGTESMRGSELTQRGTWLGTPPYMSPEQFSDEPLDPRSDIYSLAVMTFEMLSGELPWTASSPMEWAQKHLTAPPKKLDSYPVSAHLSDRAKRAIDRALAKRREDRPADISEFLRDLTGTSDVRAAWAAATSAGLVGGPRISSLAPPPRASGSASGPVETYEPARVSGSGRAIMLVLLIAVVIAGVVVGGAALAAKYLMGPDTERTSADAGARSIEPIQPDAGAREQTSEGWFTSVHHVQNASNAQNALGPSDRQLAQIGPRGFLTLEIQPGKELRADGTPAPDLRVYVDPERSGAYDVDVSATHGGRFKPVARGARGPLAIDLDAEAARTVRYVRIENHARRAQVWIDAVQGSLMVDIGATIQPAPHAHDKQQGDTGPHDEHEQAHEDEHAHDSGPPAPVVVDSGSSE